MAEDHQHFFKLDERSHDNNSIKTVISPIKQPSFTSQELQIQGRKGLNLRINKRSKRKFNIQREDGNLLIGGFSLANNCQSILIIFGIFFIFAGVILTIISYKPTSISTLKNSSERGATTSKEGKIAGPLFLVVGSLLFTTGVVLTMINWKLYKEAKLQKNRFSLATTDGITTSELLTPSSSFSATPQSYQNFKLSTKTNNECSSFPSSRRQSLFTTSNSRTRRMTLPTISQAIPMSFLIDGKIQQCISNVGDSRINPGKSRRSSSITSQKSISSSRRKASLSLRASLPIPLLSSPNSISETASTENFNRESPELFVSKSDEPYGSIVSLSGNKDVASFPAKQTLRFHKNKVEHGLNSSSNNNSYSTIIPAKLPVFNQDCNVGNRELPIITVNECVNIYPSPKCTKLQQSRSDYKISKSSSTIVPVFDVEHIPQQTVQMKKSGDISSDKSKIFN